MDLITKLREGIDVARDAYTASQRDKRELHAFLVANRTAWDRDSVRVKIGRSNFEWLHGLVQFGDEKGWGEQL